MIEKVKSIWARSYSITKKQGEFYHAKVTDSYGNKYQSYFESAHECSKWIYYIWENEEWFNSVDTDVLLSRAIQECKEIDKQSNITTIL